MKDFVRIYGALESSLFSLGFDDDGMVRLVERLPFGFHADLMEVPRTEPHHFRRRKRAPPPYLKIMNILPEIERLRNVSLHQTSAGHCNRGIIPRMLDLPDKFAAFPKLLMILVSNRDSGTDFNKWSNLGRAVGSKGVNFLTVGLASALKDSEDLGDRVPNPRVALLELTNHSV